MPRMQIVDKECINWHILANDFVLKNENLSAQAFIKIIHDVKIKVERKMRNDLDQKLISEKRVKVIFQSILGDQ